jgi:hypothetical protein
MYNQVRESIFSKKEIPLTSRKVFVNGRAGYVLVNLSLNQFKPITATI